MTSNVGTGLWKAHDGSGINLLVAGRARWGLSEGEIRAVMANGKDSGVLVRGFSTVAISSRYRSILVI